MRIGFCLPGAPMRYGSSAAETTYDTLLLGCKAVKDAGYDYAECNLGMLMELTEAELSALVTEKENGNLCLEACNCFIPGSFSIADPAQFDALSAYVEKAMHRMELLGAKIIVFGSGKARELPMNCPVGELASIVRFIEMSAAKAAAHGITLVLEPLNKKETNLFNSVSEAASMVRKLSLEGLGLLADSYHVYMENESLLSIPENGDLLVHTHVAEAPDRSIPGSIDGAHVRAFGKALQSISYKGRVSIECNYKDFEADVRAAQPLMREAFAD